ncbi:hypothetical protein GOV03_03925 [Candidatus Woesearchaeota archaeon]|nr:hypothetical protein [Candidatus Woesearchaeota archaeon]
MKKTLVLLITVFLVSSFVFAQGGEGIHEPGTGIEDPEIKEAGQGTGQGLDENGGEPLVIQNQEQKQIEKGSQEGEMIRQKNQEKLQTGLENALTKVNNENARQRLQQNMEQFQEKYQERMLRMEGVEVEEVDEETGAVTVTAQEPVKWLGFINGKATKRFQMDGQGNINEKAPWYRFLYGEETSE